MGNTLFFKKLMRNVVKKGNVERKISPEKMTVNSNAKIDMIYQNFFGKRNGQLIIELYHHQQSDHPGYKECNQ